MGPPRCTWSGANSCFHNHSPYRGLHIPSEGVWPDTSMAHKHAYCCSGDTRYHLRRAPSSQTCRATVAIAKHKTRRISEMLDLRISQAVLRIGRPSSLVLDTRPQPLELGVMSTSNPGPRPARQTPWIRGLISEARAGASTLPLTPFGCCRLKARPRSARLAGHRSD
jgi:hypothetical protein